MTLSHNLSFNIQNGGDFFLIEFESEARGKNYLSRIIIASQGEKGYFIAPHDLRLSHPEFYACIEAEMKAQAANFWIKEKAFNMVDYANRLASIPFASKKAI